MEQGGLEIVKREAVKKKQTIQKAGNYNIFSMEVESREKTSVTNELVFSFDQ